MLTQRYTLREHATPPPRVNMHRACHAHPTLSVVRACHPIASTAVDRQDYLGAWPAALVGVLGGVLPELLQRGLVGEEVDAVAEEDAELAVAGDRLAASSAMTASCPTGSANTARGWPRNGRVLPAVRRDRRGRDARCLVAGCRRPAGADRRGIPGRSRRARRRTRRQSSTDWAGPRAEPRRRGRRSRGGHWHRRQRRAGRHRIGRRRSGPRH